ncbi:MAG: hypothetical protein KIS94_02655 [Chitinophagales bacterium]|nr:hypothetical protein [Chitinophagales bacterium]
MNKLSAFFSFLFFWLLAFVLYHKTAGAGFAFDHIGWLQNYSDKGWKGIVTAFDDKSLHYGYHLFGFTAWKLFGLNGTGWMALFITLHAVNAALSFVVFKTLFKSIGVKRASLTAFLGSVLFIVSPYQTEPVIWYACIHYLFCVALLLSSSIFLFYYLRKKQWLYVFLFYAAYTLALFTLEISFAYPVLLFLFFLFWQPQILNGSSRIRLIGIFVLPATAMLLGYFVLSYFLRGSAVGHYGAEAHLNFSIPLLMANLSKYIGKVFLLCQFYEYEKRHALFLLFEKVKFGWLLFAALALVASLFMIFKKRMNVKLQTAILLFGFFAVALLPILNLFVTYIVNVEGDRFLYFPLIFAYQFLSFTVLALLGYAGIVPMVAFIFLNVNYQQFNTQSWVLANETRTSLLESFRWWNAPRIYLLNNPDNFRGVYMFRCFPPDNLFAETLELTTAKKVEQKMFDTYQYNMNSVNDCVKVEKISDNELKVTFAQWGNWWWYKGIGAAPVSNDLFDLKVADEWNHSYAIQFKEKIPGTVYLYQCGGEWKQVEGF